MKDFIRKWILARLVWEFYKLLSWSWRLTLIEPDSLKKRFSEKTPVVLAHFHGDELVLLQLIGIYRIATIVSQSKDGELMNQMVRWVGGNSSRGSSTRGAVGAFKGLIRLMKDGWNSSFAVDGPKGPIFKVKPGVFETARLAKAPIYTAGVSCDRCWSFPRSWNKTFLPKPFAKVVVKWTEFPVNPSEMDPKSAELAQDLESLLQSARLEAQNILAST